MKNMQQNAEVLAEKLEPMGRFELIGPDEEQLPLVAFQLDRRQRLQRSSTSPGGCRPSAAGWCRRTRFRRTPKTSTIMRALVKETMSREHVDTLVQETSRRPAPPSSRKVGPMSRSEEDHYIGPSHYRERRVRRIEG